jgi:hypothetical protein
VHFPYSLLSSPLSLRMERFILGAASKSVAACNGKRDRDSADAVPHYADTGSFKPWYPAERENSVPEYYDAYIGYPGGKTFETWKPTLQAIVLCRICGYSLKLATNETSAGKTTVHWGGFRSHMQRQHYYQCALRDRKTSPLHAKNEAALKNAAALESAIMDSDEVQIATVDDKPARKLAILIAKVPTLPISLTENVHFRAFLSSMSATDSLPGAKGVMKAVAELYAEQLKELQEKIRALTAPLVVGNEMLGRFRRVALSTDCWSDNSLRGYLAVILHAYNTTERAMVKHELAIAPFSTPHTGQRVLEYLTEVLKRFGLTFSNVMGTSADGGSNIRVLEMPIRMQDARQHYLHYCFHHRLNLVTKEAGSTLDATLEPLRAMIVKLVRSTKKQVAIDRWRKARGQKALKPILPVATRYNTQFYFLKRALELLGALQGVGYAVMEYRDYEFNTIFAQITQVLPGLRSILVIMECVEKWTVRLSTVLQTTLSLIPTAVDAIKTACQPHRGALSLSDAVEEQNRLLVKNFADKLVDSLSARFRPVFHIDAAELLDVRTIIPRLAKPNFLRSLAFTADWMVHMSMTDSPPGRTVHNQGSAAELLALMSTASAVDAAAEEYAAPTPLSAADINRDEKAKRANAIAVQLDTYRKMSEAIGTKLTIQEINHIDPCAFMVDMASTIPVVAHYAVELLSIPAAEAECERLFSLAGIVLSETRSRMLPANANKLCLLNRWLPDREQTSLAAATMKAKKATRDLVVACTAKAVTVALDAIRGGGAATITGAAAVQGGATLGAALVASLGEAVSPLDAAATSPATLQGLPLESIFEEVVEMSAEQVLEFTSTTETEGHGGHHVPADAHAIEEHFEEVPIDI